MPEALVSHALGIRHWSSYTILGLRVEVNTPTVFASPYDAPKFGRMLDGYST